MISPAFTSWDPKPLTLLLFVNLMLSHQPIMLVIVCVSAYEFVSLHAHLTGAL